jgi:nicotinamidase-related amidase
MPAVKLAVHTRPEQRRPNLAVVVVDMQLSIRTPYETAIGYRYGILSEGIARLCRVLQCAKELGIPIILIENGIVCFDTKRGLETRFPEVLPEVRAAVSGYDYVRWIRKRTVDAFGELTLERELKNFGVESVIFLGYRDTACVLETACTANARGYKVVVAKQGLFKLHDDGDELKYERALSRYRQIGKLVETVEELTHIAKQRAAWRDYFSTFPVSMNQR